MKDIENYHDCPPSAVIDSTIASDSKSEMKVEHNPLSSYTENKVPSDKDYCERVGSSNSSRTNNSLLQRATRLYKRHKWVVVLLVGMFFTAWWISIIAQPSKRHKWLIPTILWLMLMIRLVTFYVRTRPLVEAMNWVWQRTFIKVRNFIPEKYWDLTEGMCVLAVILVGTFVSPEHDSQSKRSDRAVSFAGLVFMYGVLFLASNNKRKVKWHTISMGILVQFIVALFVLRTKCGYDIFDFISFLARKLLTYAKDGVAFVVSADVAKMPLFIVTALPCILFFIAFCHIFLYYGVIQWAIKKFSVLFFWLMGVSGAEAIVAAASPFIGQGENAVLIKPFIPYLTDAELFQVLVSGFATISGSMLSTYIGMGLNGQALITSCVMSIPSSLAAAKLAWPETEESMTARTVVEPPQDEDKPANALHAFANGAALGLNVALSILVNILCIIALVALIDALLTWFGGFWNIPHLTLQQIFGYIFYPFAVLLGITDKKDIYRVAELLGIKMIQNEFVAYMALLSPEYADLSVRSKMLATYALCGFSNLGSVGIQLGVLGEIDPNIRGRVSRMVLTSMVVGCISTFSSAATAGMVLNDLSAFEKTATVATA